MAIPQLDIKGLKGVGDVELRFDADARVVVLFGENGVGKTKCLEALFLFLLCTNKSFVKSAKVFELHSPQESFVSSFSDSGRTIKLPPQIRFVLLSDVKEETPVVYLGAGQRASLSKLQNSNQSACTYLGNSADRRTEFFKKIYTALNDAHQLASLGMGNDIREWAISRAQSANHYQKQADNRQVEVDTLVRVLHEMEKQIDSQFFEIDGKGRVSIKVKGLMHELGELSSGYISLVKIIQAIIAGYGAWTNETQLQNVRGTVFIDEIESHMHVEWQVKIVGLLKKLFPNTTFYMATHSPLVLTQLDDNEAYKLVRHEDGVMRSHQMQGAYWAVEEFFRRA